jgi:uncharacterized protein YbjT (DUF2867 family)
VRVFVAGGSGVIGKRIVRLLVEAGNGVAAMTRSPGKAATLRELGAEPIVCDVYDAEALIAAVRGFAPDAVVHQLTDLPDDMGRIAELGGANARIRREGTRNLVAAARGAGATSLAAQSVAWAIPGDGGAAVRELEDAVLAVGGTVLRYGRLYGPETYYEDTLPPPPRVHVDEAAERTVAALISGEAGIVTIVEGESGEDE